MTDPITELWCLIEGQHDICVVPISPNERIDILRQKIYELGKSYFVRLRRSYMDLIITKVCCIMISM
jgi:hypothetical protein